MLTRRVVGGGLPLNFAFGATRAADTAAEIIWADPRADRGVHTTRS